MTCQGLPFLFVLTFFLAIASCSSIWFCKCRSRFCSISSCDLNPRIAFLGVSFRCWALCPPNQPHTPDIVLVQMYVGPIDSISTDHRALTCVRELSKLSSTFEDASSCDFRDTCYRSDGGVPGFFIVGHRWLGEDVEGRIWKKTRCKEG